MKAGRIKTILDGLEPFLKTCKEANSCKKYLIKNKKRLNYPYFRKLGLCTSSGNVKSGCRHVMRVRVKQSDVNWTIQGANAIIALRCSKLSSRFDDFMAGHRESA